jgi:hypothetical protein
MGLSLLDWSIFIVSNIVINIFAAWIIIPFLERRYKKQVTDQAAVFMAGIEKKMDEKIASVSKQLVASMTNPEGEFAGAVDGMLSDVKDKIDTTIDEVTKSVVMRFTQSLGEAKKGQATDRAAINGYIRDKIEQHPIAGPVIQGLCDAWAPLAKRWHENPGGLIIEALKNPLIGPQIQQAVEQYLQLEQGMIQAGQSAAEQAGQGGTTGQDLLAAGLAALK